MKIKAGNSVDLVYSVTDSDGVVVSNLSTATAVKFMVKTNETDTNAQAKISKSLGAGIVVNTPIVGSITISLTATDTTILAGAYFMAIQIEWGTTIQEISLKEGAFEVVESNILNIIQDVIR